MVAVDLTTVLIGYMFGNLVCAILLYRLWRDNGSRYHGLGWWMTCFISNLFGIILQSGRDILPDYDSMLLGSLSMVMGVYFLYIGVERFMLNKGIPRYLLILIAAYLVLQIFYIYIERDLRIRNILFSTILVLFSFQFLWFYFKQLNKEERKITRNLVFVTSLFGITAIARIVLNLAISPGIEPANSANYEALIYLVFQMLYIVLTISLFMLVNRRLYIDLEMDIEERKKTERALQESEEKYSRAFRSSPDAVMITRIKDGRIIEVNDAFQKSIGYSREEALGKSTISLGIWKNPDERTRLLEEMQNNSIIRNMHFDVKTRTGRVILAELSGEYIKIGEEDCMLAVVRDISERKRTDDILHLRLLLWDYSLSHTPLQVMKKALDEIESLTGSQIGFFHLYEEESKTLSLQGWSTRTEKVFCKAEGSGMHYPMDQAGVWVDCIRERKTVIHNDYASLPHKKGMPDGHARLVRELVVPTFENEQIVSILGIGNKEADYDERDVELVEYLANLVWTIVAKMHAEEKVRQLNEQLETLAMSDELTGIPNRRSFFLRGNEEISRSRRYGTPLSLIMLDIDKFKIINDTYGHDTGDLALHCIAKTIKDQCREVDFPARLGGEEFGILLPNTLLEEAVVVAERMRIAIENLHCLTEGRNRNVSLTASFGVASMKPEMKLLDALFHNADTAMYQAKNAGRNRVVLYE